MDGCISAGTVAFFLVSFLFLVIRQPAVLLLSAVVVALLSAVFPDRDPVLSVLGLLLYGFGLSAVRVMLRRSVSLHLLRRVARGEAAADAREAFAARLDDAERFGLIVRIDRACVLTPFGATMGAIVAVLYTLTGNRA